VLVVNGRLTDESRTSVEPLVDRIIVRPNVDFDVGAYRDGLRAIGYGQLARDLDELLLFNHTFYGPIQPFEDMFSAMDSRDHDFWGISSHKEVRPNPMTGMGILAEHINSHFIAVRRPVLSSPQFEAYWEGLGPIRSYEDSVLKHESIFTRHFADMGYRYSCYVDSDRYSSYYPVFVDIDRTILDRSPILKRRLFFHDPLFHDAHGINLPRAIEAMRTSSAYDTQLIWKNIARSTKPRDLAVNAGLLRILPDEAPAPVTGEKALRIAACIHVTEVSLLAEVLAHTQFLPPGSELIVTTDADEKRGPIEAALSDAGASGWSRVLVTGKAIGRDAAALLITCRDLLLADRYDLVCRLHTKETAALGDTAGEGFRHYLLDNLLASPGYVERVIEVFGDPSVGLAFPPAFHIGTPIIGNAWEDNRAAVEQLARSLGVTVPLDDDTPLAPYGSMFWFRPAALRGLLEKQWVWDEFDPEKADRQPVTPDVLDRVLCYVAAGGGYLSVQIMNPRSAAHSYAHLDFKFQKLMTAIGVGGHFDHALKSVQARSSRNPLFRVAIAAKRMVQRRPLLKKLVTPVVRAVVPLRIRQLL
jgi:lipopolysaccharide biosynthesis protein